MKSYSLFLLLSLLIIQIPASGQTGCESFQAVIESSTGSFSFCPGSQQARSFIANASYASGLPVVNPDALQYTWKVSGNTHNGRMLNLPFPNPGAYSIRLEVFEPQTGCRSVVYETVRVSTMPDFGQTVSSSESVCAREVFTLRGNAAMQTWTGFPTTAAGPFAIPDGTGSEISIPLQFNVFEPDAAIVSAADLDRICLNLSHMDYGHLKIELECPTGIRVMLKDYSAGGANLGEPVVWDPAVAGRGYDYCFNNQAQFGNMAATAHQFHAYTDVLGNYYFNASYLPQGSYTPDETLDKLAGCPLNGTWTLHVKDNQAGDHGHLLSWSLFFDEAFYPDSLIFTPFIASQRWLRGNTAMSPVPGNPGNIVNTSLQQAGLQEYRFEVTDNFGCAFDTTLMVRALPLPEAEILSQLELPVCEGDSSLFTVLPRGSGLDLVYQWLVNGNEMPGRTNDTIMVKEAATYGVLVTNTTTGCRDQFSLEFTERNCDLVIPNVFTPNGDGINDLFEIVNLEHYPMAEIVIHNRWGKKVFEHSDYYMNWWDGRNQPDGVYYYVLRYAREDGKIRFAHGAVTIIR